MKRTINLFMWGYQAHFRIAMGSRARTVLGRAGAETEPKALLVGVRDPKAVPEGHPVCVEPGDGEWDPRTFFRCADRASQIERDHPDWQLIYGDESRTRDQPENIRRKSVRQSVVEVLEDWDRKHDTVSFAGAAMRLADYHVVPVLQFSARDFAKVPRFSSPVRFGEFGSPHGFLEAVIDRLLVEAATALQLPEPGRYFRTLETDPTALLREAGDSVCSAVTLATQDVLFQGVFEMLNAVSALRYEGAASAGRIAFVPKQSTAVDRRLSLAAPVTLRQPRLARKVVEMSGGELCCICHGEEGISALGLVNDPDAPDLIRVEFADHYRWDLYHRRQKVMTVAYGVPRVPTARLKNLEFNEYLQRIFPAIADNSAQALWSLVEAALDQRHGTMLVVSEAAPQEAARLRTQGLPIQPTALTPDIVLRITGIDGAVLVDSEAICHAVGVILDGQATTAGDPSRGARYNSAVRYVSGADAPTLCIVVSEDGYVDLVPMLRPQISKREVEARVEAMKTKTIDDYMKTYSWLDEHRFYLGPEQCEVVNRQLERILSTPMEVGEIRLRARPFVSDPEMNDSYFLNEGAG